jgi:mannose-6-phosphate isomerase-like protein (cupin superfamily)
MLEQRRIGVLALLVAGSSTILSCAPESAPPRPYQANILEIARSNDVYRRVVHTGAQIQTVVMSIPPGGDIGEELHARVEQILICAAGSGTAMIDGVASPFRPGDMVVVTPGTRHNFINTGDAPLQIYTFYAPPNHLPGRVQRTKADAEADVDDNAYGRRVEESGPCGP